MKLKRKSALKTSMIVMFFGFLLSIFGLFGDRVMADSSVTASQSNTLVWVVVGSLGVIAIVIGLIGVVFGMAAYRD